MNKSLMKECLIILKVLNKFLVKIYRNEQKFDERIFDYIESFE